MSTQEMIGEYGVSFAHGKKYYQEVFGNEREVLVKVADMLCELQKADGWDTCPPNAIQGAKRYWQDLKRMN